MSDVADTPVAVLLLRKSGRAESGGRKQQRWCAASGGLEGRLGDLECSQPAPPKPPSTGQCTLEPALTLALASPPTVEARDMRIGEARVCSSSHRLPIHQRHCETRRAIRLPVPRFVLTAISQPMHVCSITHVVLALPIAITTTDNIYSSSTSLNKAYIHALISPGPTLRGPIDNNGR
jgi:hypothetical protein